MSSSQGQVESRDPGVVEAPHNFCWYELMTTEPKDAQEFYSHVVGWTARDAGMEGFPYTLLSAGNTEVGGMMELPAAAREAGARPGWLGYIGVDDVDSYTKQVEQAGGSLHRAPEDIPGIGRFSVVADPQGAIFVLFKDQTGQAPQPPVVETPGHFGWHELHATDGPKAFDFYSQLFGWVKGEALDMGPDGVYQLFHAGEPAIGGMMSRNKATPGPHWLFYINVDDIDSAIARANDKGGQLLFGPQEVPGGGWIAMYLDPQKAMFAMVGPKKS